MLVRAVGMHPEGKVIMEIDCIAALILIPFIIGIIKIAFSRNRKIQH
jgi:hypothetical protein